MLALLLAATLSVQAPDARAEAERLARTGAHQEALERFRALAVENPRDLDARVWIARLHVMLGHLRQGEDVYRSVLIESPDRLDALVGLGSALTSRGRFAEARRHLSQAERQAPDDLDVLAAQGRLSLMDDRDRLAAAYYGRATLIAPEQYDLRINFEEARRRYDHRIEATYFNEAFNGGTPDSQSGEVTVDFRARDELRAYARGQRERKFNESDTVGGAGIDWQVNRPWLTSLEAHAFAGPGNDVLPRADTGLAAGWRGVHATFAMRGRYYQFNGAHLWAIGPSLRVHARDDLVVSASYTRTLTEFSGLEDLVGHHAGDLRVDVRVRPRLWLGAGYARGIEDFDRVTADRLGDFNAHTYSGTARLDLRSLTTLAATYEHQRVETFDLRMNRVTARIVQRF